MLIRATDKYIFVWLDDEQHRRHARAMAMRWALNDSLTFTIQDAKTICFLIGENSQG